jgi:hypothetical protein
MAAQEGRNLVTVPADGHRAPAAAMSSGIVIEKEAAGRIGAAADGRGRTFDEELGCGTGNRGEQPLEAAFAGDIVEGPGTFAGHQLIVAFGDAENLVDGFDPGRGKPLPLCNRRKDGAQGFTQTEDAKQHGVDGKRLSGKEGPEAGSALLRHKAGIDEEGHKLLPGEVVRGGGEVGKVESQAASDERRVAGGMAGHVTGLAFREGYIRLFRKLNEE